MHQHDRIQHHFNSHSHEEDDLILSSASSTIIEISTHILTKRMTQKHKYHHDCKDKCCKNQSEYNTFHEQTGHLFVMSLFSLPYPVHSFQMPDSDASFLFCHSHVLPLFCEVDSCLFPALLLSVGMLFSVQSLVITLE